LSASKPAAKPTGLRARKLTVSAVNNGYLLTAKSDSAANAYQRFAAQAHKYFEAVTAAVGPKYVSVFVELSQVKLESVAEPREAAFTRMLPLSNATDLLMPVNVKTTVLFFAVCGPKFTRLCQQTWEIS